MGRLASAALTVSLIFLWPSRVVATTVMIVRPDSPSAELTETVSRLHGELLSVGLVVTIAERPATGEPEGVSARAWLESLVLDRGIDAAIDVIGSARLEAADIWVVQPAPRPWKTTRVSAERDVENAPARLAIRAIDLLRSMLIERDLYGASPRAASAASPAPTLALAKPTTTAPIDVSEARRGARVGFELGAAALASLDGVGPAILPLVRIDVSVGPWLGLQGEVAGFGTRPTLGRPGANARVAQQYAVLGACVCAPSAARVRPVLGLSAGALRTAADGQADAPLQGHTVAQWSFLLEASAGVRVRLAKHSYLTLAAHVQVAEPYVDIRVVDAAAATSGRPNLLLTIAAGQWL